MRFGKPMISSIMPLKVMFSCAIVLGVIIIIANYTVQFNIASTPLTFGALTYPFSFLLLDILSEKYPKKEVIKVLTLGLLIAFYPSYLSATPNIALASIAAFCISQPLDITLFYMFKKYFPKLWWLRNTASSIIAQFVDTLLFFGIAFFGARAFGECIEMAMADYTIKALLIVANTPLFYLIAIKAKSLWKCIT